MQFLNWVGEHPYIFFASLWLVCMTIESCVKMALNYKEPYDEFMEEQDEAI